MLRRLILMLLLALSSGVVSAQECASGAITLTTQMELDALGVTGCDSVSGALVIKDSDITNLDGLVNLQSVNNGLTIVNTGITDLDGLANLMRVGGVLDVRDNPVLKNVDGLLNLATVGGIFVRFNHALTNLDGLVNLRSVEGSLNVRTNNALINLAGLANIQSVEGSLEVFNNKALMNLDSFINLQSVGGKLDVSNNMALTNLDGFVNLQSVGGSIIILGNKALTNLDGLASLQSVAGSLTVRSNDVLTNLDGLVNIQNVEGILTVQTNGALNSCSGIALLLGWPDGPPNDKVRDGINLFSLGGPPSCSSVEQILTSLIATAPTITNVLANDGSLRLTFKEATVSSSLYPFTGYNAICATGTEATTAPSLNLLDNTPIESTVTITGSTASGSTSSIEVTLDITHDRAAHLLIYLTSPSGTRVTLWDKSTQSVTNIVGNFPIDFIPADDLSLLVSDNMNGDWVLHIEDVVAGTIIKEGVLNKWGVRVTERAVVNGNNSPLLVSGLTNGQEYSCSVVPVSRLPQQASTPVVAVPPSDSDADGVPDTSDAFPINAAESVDTDGDGIGNNADSDDDGDGTADASDPFPLDNSLPCVGISFGAARLGAGQFIELPIRGTCVASPSGDNLRVPSAATAASLNVTAVTPDAAGFVTVWPCGVARPNASNLNFVAGDVVPNGVVAPIGSNGSVCLYSSQATELIVDVAGWFEGEAFVGATPQRLVDTRDGTGGQLGQLVDEAPLVVQATGIAATTATGVGTTIPSTAGTVALNVTAVNPDSPGFITVYPCDAPRPLASNLNFVAGQVVANGVLAPVSSSGQVCLYSQSPTDIIVDLAGWFPGDAFTGATPSRLVDTRDGTGAPLAKLSPSGQLSVAVQGSILSVNGNSAQVPLDASAAALNVTVVNPESGGFVTVWPCSTARPNASNLNFTTGKVVANNVVAPIGDQGNVCFFASQNTDIIVDISGYFTGESGNQFVGSTPKRFVDTRDGTGPAPQ